MNRRGFLGLLAGVASGAVLDPEKLLWVPGKTLISIPAPILTQPPDFMLTTEFTKALLAALASNLAFARVVNRRYSEEF